jgi:predicted Zn-dependent protease
VRKDGSIGRVNTWAFWALWILGPTLLGLALGQPLLLLGVVAALVLYRWLPDPAVWLRSAAKKRSLEDAIHVNPDNTTARRDLAMILLERKRAKRAIPVLTAARDVTPEIEFLLGCAHLESRAPQEALVHLGKALERDAKLRYGDPHLFSARAHLALGKLDDAEQALARFVQMNGSSIEGHVRLARVRGARGDKAGARAAWQEARTTYRALPPFQRKRQRGWYARALLGV